MFSFTPLPHTEAERRIADLPVVTREVMRGLVPELQAHAFTVAGLQGAEQMARVKKILATVPAGANWTAAKKQVVAELTAGGLDPKTVQRRAETLLRTTAFRAYAATRYRVLMAQTDVFPFWQYKTAGDGNVRPAHTALHNQVFPAGHEIWQRIFPPWGWGCRCLVVPLTKRAAERMRSADSADLTDSESESQSAKSAKSADDNLLPGQTAKPVIYTPKEADLISRSARLPGGISLEVDPTWGRSPWSEKGNLRPSWDYLESLYKDDPEVFAAFCEWSEKTEIRKGVTVSAWIGGRDSAKAAKRAVFDDVPGFAKTAEMREADNAFIREHQVPRANPPSEHVRPSDPATRDAHSLAMEKAALLQDTAHDDGGLEDVVTGGVVKTANAAGEYIPKSDKAPARANVSPETGTPILTSLHEYGHHAETALGAERVGRVARAARDTAAMREIGEKFDPEDVEYYSRDDEVFARAYAQFVARVSGDAEVADELRRVAESWDSPRYWDDKDFEPVRAALMLALKEINWL